MGNPNYMFRLDDARRARWQAASRRAGAPDIATWLKAMADKACDLQEYGGSEERKKLVRWLIEAAEGDGSND